MGTVIVRGDFYLLFVFEETQKLGVANDTILDTILECRAYEGSGVGIGIVPYPIDN